MLFVYTKRETSKPIVFFSLFLNSHFHLNCWIRSVITNLKIRKFVIFQKVTILGNSQVGEGTRNTLELLLKRVDVILVDVSITEGVDEVARLESSSTADQQSEESIRGNVEGDTEAHIAGALVELAREFVAGGVGVELGHDVARREGHLVDCAGVPGGEEHATVVGAGLEGFNDALDLIDALTVVVGLSLVVVSTEVAPLETINGAKITFAVLVETTGIKEFTGAIALPDVDVLGFEQLGVGVATEEPDQFFTNTLPEDTLGGKEGPAPVAEGEAHLRAEEADGSDTSAVFLDTSIGEDVLDEVDVLVFFFVAGNVAVEDGLAFRESLRSTFLLEVEVEVLEVGEEGGEGLFGVGDDVLVDAGQEDGLEDAAAGFLSSLLVDVSATEVPDLLNAVGERRLGEEFQGSLETATTDDHQFLSFFRLFFGLPGFVGGQDHGETTGHGAELGGDRLVGLSAHDDGVDLGSGLGTSGSLGGLFEELQVFGDVPGDLGALADAVGTFSGGDHDGEGAEGEVVTRSDGLLASGNLESV